MPAHLSPLRDVVLEYSEQGMGAQQIADKIGRPRSTVSMVVSRLRSEGAPVLPLQSQRGWTFSEPTSPFTPAQQRVVDLLRAGCTQADVARRMRVSPPAVTQFIQWIGLKCEVTRNTLRPTPVPRVLSPHDDDDETPREARERISRDISAGKRCGRCWLLIPCDHE